MTSPFAYRVAVIERFDDVLSSFEIIIRFDQAFSSFEIIINWLHIPTPDHQIDSYSQWIRNVWDSC